MKQLNMMVDDEVKQAAVDGARQSGMLLNKWVSRAILDKFKRDAPNDQGLREPAPVPRTWTGIWENELLSDEWKYFPEEDLCVGSATKRGDGGYRGELIGVFTTREKAQACVVESWEKENA